MTNIPPELEEICTCNNLDHSYLSKDCPANNVTTLSNRPEGCITKITEIKLRFVTHTSNADFNNYVAKKLIERYAKYVESVETYWLEEE